MSYRCVALLLFILIVLFYNVPLIKSNGVLKGEVVKTNKEGPFFPGSSAIISMLFKSLVNDTVVGLTIQWKAPPFLKFIEIRLYTKAGNVGKERSFPAEQMIKFEDFNETQVPSVKVDLRIDPNNETQKGETHNVTTWFRARYTLLSNWTADQEEQWFPYPLVFYTPACETFQSLRTVLKESHFAASTLSRSTLGKSGRSPFYATLSQANFWMGGDARKRSINEFVELEFVKKVHIEMLASKGLQIEKVFSLRLYTSDDEIHWKTHHGKTVNLLEFPVNYDHNLVAVIALDPPIKARFVRINPNSWSDRQKFNFDVYGCVLDNITTKSPLDYGNPLGVESGDILDNQFSSSSASLSTFEPFKARLNSDSAWCMAENSLSEYLQIDLLTSHVIQQVATQNKHVNDYGKELPGVTSYYLQYSLTNYGPFEFYKHNGNQKIFLGNTVENQVVKHKLLRPITARYLRFLAKTYVIRICFRVELYGRQNDEKISPDLLPVLKRSFLVEPESGLVFMCNVDVQSFTSRRKMNVNYCFYMTRKDNYKIHWTGFGVRLLSIMGYDKKTNTVYGVGQDRKIYVKCQLHKSNAIYGIAEAEWLRVRDSDSMILATEVPFMPVTQLDDTNKPSASLTILDNKGNSWGASALGLHLNNQLIASWNSIENNHCQYSPCQNGGTCQNHDNGFICKCGPGFTGQDCNTVIDVCENSNCDRSRSFCQVTGFASRTCVCHAGLGGKHCTGLFLADKIHSDSSEFNNGSYMINVSSLNIKVYYDKTANVSGWILIARFSNTDNKNWMNYDGSWWYDVTVAKGDTTDPSINADMLSPAFWLVSGRNFKITRSDDPYHTPLLQTTDGCLNGLPFRYKMTGYGDFRRGPTWASNRCLGSCTVEYGGQFLTTDGFQEATCNGNIQSANKIGFWCDWDAGDGSVMMIGGGGNECSGADHGIGITGQNSASFSQTDEMFDFGFDSENITHGLSTDYSLNLWIR